MVDDLISFADEHLSIACINEHYNNNNNLFEINIYDTITINQKFCLCINITYWINQTDKTESTYYNVKKFNLLITFYYIQHYITFSHTLIIHNPHTAYTNEWIKRIFVMRALKLIKQWQSCKFETKTIITNYWNYL